jgi:signal transduction histidine kinase
MRRQALRLEIPGGLPPVWADRQRVAQVASNLMTNAFRYTPEGGAITISARKGEREIEVTVTDTGPGISPEYHALIFEKFARVEVRGPRPQGSTGLGLAISKALVERQGGWIKVWSEPGKGSAFTFALPVAASAPYVSGRPSTELHSVSANAA